MRPRHPDELPIRVTASENDIVVGHQPHERRPPGPREREIKGAVREAWGRLNAAIGPLTEGGEVIAETYKSLPWWRRTPIYDCRTGRHRRPTVPEMLARIRDHYDEIDVDVLAGRLANNAIEDAYYGAIGGAVTAATRPALGHSGFGFGTDVAAGLPDGTAPLDPVNERIPRPFQFELPEHRLGNRPPPGWRWPVESTASRCG